jgi:hypothetical protein
VEAATGLAGSETKAEAQKRKEERTTEKYRKNIIAERRTSAT